MHANVKITNSIPLKKQCRLWNSWFDLFLQCSWFLLACDFPFMCGVHVHSQLCCRCHHHHHHPCLFFLSISSSSSSSSHLNNLYCKHLVIIIIHVVIVLLLYNGKRFYALLSCCCFENKMHVLKLCIWHHLSSFIVFYQTKWKSKWKEKRESESFRSYLQEGAWISFVMHLQYTLSIYSFRKYSTSAFPF